MPVIIKFGKRTINIEKLDAELRAALREHIAGVMQDWDGEVGVVVEGDEVPEVVRAEVEAVLAAHDPNAKTAAQLRLERRLAALGDIKVTDLIALRDELEAATTVADFKRLLRKMFILMYRLIQLNEATDDDLGD